MYAATALEDGTVPRSPVPWRGMDGPSFGYSVYADRRGWGRLARQRVREYDVTTARCGLLRLDDVVGFYLKNDRWAKR